MNSWTKLLSILLLEMIFIVAFSYKAVAADSDLKKENLNLAYQIVKILKITDQFDMILPESALSLRTRLTNINPDLSKDISKIVDEETLKIVSERATLEEEISKVYENSFTQDELKNILTFYNSTAGKKLLDTAPEVMNKIFMTADLWKRKISEKLYHNVQNRLDKKISQKKKN